MQRQELLRQLDQRQDALYKLVEDFQKALKHLSLDIEEFKKGEKAEELKTLNEAETLLKSMSHAEVSNDKFFDAWKALWNVLNPHAESEDEVEMARRMA